VMVIWIQSDKSNTQHQDSIESLEKEIKYLWDKLDLLRQRIQLLPEWEQRTKTEEEYTKTKEEIENLTIKHSLLSSK
jgi:prefoldin subunit 5